MERTGEGILRELLWLNHGCSIGMLYGDDGEMQCNNMNAHIPIDFRRDPAAEIKRKLMHKALKGWGLINQREFLR